MCRWIAPTVAVATIAAASWCVWAAARAESGGGAVARASSVAEESIDVIAPLHDGRLQFQGSLSCAATACHGRVLPEQRPFDVSGIYGNEYHVWLEQDPHARAERTLSSEKTSRILERLEMTRTDRSFQHCLSCHSPNSSISSADQPPSSLAGVSCESCHGPAEKWLGEHFRSDWDRTAARSAGMIDTKKLLVRARLCADCHVGSEHREVNHDLIAAGHPPLKFELSAYLSLLPKHWNDAEDRIRRADYEVQLWAAGQVASAAAALAQLESRAARAAAKNDDAVWPEFAEFDCFACHHDLTAPSWPQERPLAGVRPGMAPWGSWYFTMLERLSQTPNANSHLQQFDADLDELRTLMQSGISPNADAVRDTAHTARQSIATLMAESNGESVAVHRMDVSQMLIQIGAEEDAKEAGVNAVKNWDTAAQIYLAVVAAHQAHFDELQKAGEKTTAADEDLTRKITNLRQQLVYLENYDSPEQLRRSNGGEPDQASPSELFRRRLLDVLRDMTNP